jgi:putative transposase
MPRYHRHFALRQTVFLTLSTRQRTTWLAATDARERVLEALCATKRLYPFVHHGHVLLDDHLHLLLTPVDALRTPLLVGSFKRAALARCAQHGRRLWQKRYHDHVIRDLQDFRRHLDYLHFNPVKHRLVSRAIEWPWSSLAQWVARGAYPPDWGEATAHNLGAFAQRPFLSNRATQLDVDRSGAPGTCQPGPSAA